MGTDAPETVKSGTPIEAFGVQASDFTKQKIADAGNRVRLAFDGEQLDRFGRTLAMVYLTMPNRLLGVAIRSVMELKSTKTKRSNGCKRLPNN